MKETLKVPFIEGKNEEKAIPVGAAKIKLDAHNWGADYPYAPEVKAALWHDNKNLYIDFEVNEETIAGLATEDHGPVYKDSCVEFFISFADDNYYNIETNCIGTVLMSNRKGRNIDVVYADEEIMKSIERKPSLGHEKIETKEAKRPWELRLKIPAKAFFKDSLQSFGGVKAKCNFYKCGDNLPKPHFMSWQAVSTPTPDFHRPEFFGEIDFE